MLVNGDEQDVFTAWRHLYCYLKRPGAAKRVKRQANRRYRQQAKQDLRKSGE